MPRLIPRPKQRANRPSRASIGTMAMPFLWVMGPNLQEMAHGAAGREGNARAGMLSQLQSTTTPNTLLLSVEIRS